MTDAMNVDFIIIEPSYVATLGEFFKVRMHLSNGAVHVSYGCLVAKQVLTAKSDRVRSKRPVNQENVNISIQFKQLVFQRKHPAEGLLASPTVHDHVAGTIAAVAPH